MGRAIQIDAILSGVIDPNTSAAAAGGSVHFYSPGTLTAKNVWTEAAKSNAYSTYSLDAAGSAHLYGDGIYDIVVKNALGSTIYEWDGVRLQYPDFQTTSVATNYTQVFDDDAITITESATADVYITLLDVDEWDDKPIVISNANSTYSVHIYPESGSGQTIDGDAYKSIQPGFATITIFSGEDDFFSSASSGSLTATSGRSAVAESGGLKDAPTGGADPSYFLTGDADYSCRIISAVMTVTYSSASQLIVAFDGYGYYGFNAPPDASSGAISSSGSANGLGFDSNYIRISNTAAYSNAVDTAYFVGVISATITQCVKTTTGTPTVALLNNGNIMLSIMYYEDGVATNLLTALSSSGDAITINLCYAMRLS